MAFLFIAHDGSTQTVQAAVRSTPLPRVVEFAPLLNGDRLTVRQDQNFSTTADVGGRSIPILADGLGNAMVACAVPGAQGPTQSDTSVFLSHNLRQVTLNEALADPVNFTGQIFDMIDCTAAIMQGGVGHHEWFRFNPDGSLSSGDGAGPTPIANPDLSRARAQVDAMLSTAGWQISFPGGTAHVRAQIYELNINGNRMFFILEHVTDNSVTPPRQFVGLWIMR